MIRRTGFEAPLFLREAFAALVRYPLRTGLSLLGLVIGVASVVGTLALLAASNRLSLEGLARFGALDLVQVRSPQSVFRDGRPVEVQKRVALDARDLARLRELLPDLRASDAQVSVSVTARRGAAAKEIAVNGGGADTPSFFPMTLESGRFLDAREAEAAARVVVISVGLAEDLFDGKPAVGEEVLLGAQRFTVVGVIRPPKDFNGEDPRTAYIPFRAAIERLGANPLATELLLAAPSVARVAAVRETVERLLPSLRPGIGADSYEVETSEEDLAGVTAQARMQALILGGVALLAMLAACSGILNTLLVG